MTKTRTPRAWARVNDLAQPLQAAGHVAVVVDLVAVIDTKAGIGLPEEDDVVAAELALAVVQNFVDAVTASLTVVEGGVVHEEEGLCVGTSVPFDTLAGKEIQIERVAQGIPHTVQLGGLFFVAPDVCREVVLKVGGK